ncbi:hypothetical protein V8J88_07625 [Massilia sp. W12]|uniref:hypothetical protein n=1 Tax=Massilia sp. W12 TaxID=3126507 RepID=UPI0030D0120B
MALSENLQKLYDMLSCCTYNGAQHTHILIEETDQLAKLKKVTLKAPNGDWFSFCPDEGRKCKRLQASSNLVIMSPLLKIGEKHDHHRACDCVVLINKNEQITALYIDLKSGNPVGYKGQFQSTRQFVRYALGLLEEFHGIKLTLAQERFAVLYGGEQSPLNKTTTVPKPIKTTQPDAPYKKEVSNAAELKMNELLV